MKSKILDLKSKMGLAAAFAEENNLDGFQEDTDFEEEGHILNIKEVVLELFNGIFN